MLAWGSFSIHKTINIVGSNVSIFNKNKMFLLPTGDVVGPAFPEIPVSTNCLLGMELMGADADAYNFAANLWSLHYLRLTNQLSTEKEFKVNLSLNLRKRVSQVFLTYYTCLSNYVM